MQSGRKSERRTIGILAPPHAQLLDVAGPVDVFAEANAQARRDVYDIQVLAMTASPVASSSGLRIVPDRVLGANDAPDIFDTLLVAGAPDLGEVESASSPIMSALITYVQRTAPRCRRFGSICSGAMILGASGLLDGRRVTTHWAVAGELARRHPDIVVEVDALYVRDRKLRTAAGVTAGLDLALALVEEDLGRDIAKRVASQLVMFFKRPGGQLQFSRRDGGAATGHASVRDLQRWIAANLGADLGMAALSARCGLSARHLARLFRQEVGVTPSGWIESVRIDAARSLLESGERPKQVASACGFADIDTFRRAFLRRLGVTPAEYRRRFGARSFG